MTTTATDRSDSLPVFTIAAASFCVVLILLALQIRAGRDPAIGAAKPAQAVDAARPVVVRRIVVRRIVESAGPAPATGGQAVASTASSAPVAAPIAQAPAPAPAPVVSSGS